MITIYGDPLSVHTRKVIVTTIVKKIAYKVVVPDSPPPNRRKQSPAGLIPTMQDGDVTLAGSTAICLYLEKKQPLPAILPGAPCARDRALRFDAYADDTVFPHLVHPLFTQTIVAPKIRKVRSDTRLIGGLLADVQPAMLDYLESQIEGIFLVGSTMTLPDIAIASNFIVYQYIGYKIDSARYPKLVRYVGGIAEHEAFRKALDDEKPFVARLGLDRSFLDWGWSAICRQFSAGLLDHKKRKPRATCAMERGLNSALA